MKARGGPTHLLDRIGNPRHLSKTRVFLLALLTGTALAMAALSPSVSGQDGVSLFTQDSGAQFAEESYKFDVGYEPTPMVVVKEMLKLAAVGPGDFLIDLGSGDGRIVITAAKELGARAMGVDLNPGLVELSRRYAEKMGVGHRSSFYVQDLFAADLAKADVVTAYLHPEVNLKLRPKLWNDLRPGTRVVSHDYHLGEWRPDQVVFLDIARADGFGSTLYLWIMPAKVSGQWEWRLPASDGDQRFSAEFSQRFQEIGGVVREEKGKWRLLDAFLRGEEIAFSLVREGDSPAMRQDYKGRIQGDVIEGAVTLGGGGRETKVTWRASRKAAAGEAPGRRGPVQGK